MQSCLPDAAIGTNVFTHAYDSIGNHVLGGANAETNTFVANCLNQRVSVLGASAPPRELAYAADGGLANDGRFAYAYDAEDRLASVTSLAPTNGAVRVRNEYDWRSRRVAKCVDRYDADAEEWRPAERHDFAWDNWNIVHETVSTFAGAATNVTEVQYFWGPDLSGTLDGAGGVGGLLAVSRDGHFYFPVYDNNGNIMKYIDESGDVVAAYAYDDFGSVISLAGDLAASFVFGFSTKYYDHEICLLAYQLRFYRPSFCVWQNRDPIEETGGENLYEVFSNQPCMAYDSLGLKISRKISHQPINSDSVRLNGRSYLAMTFYALDVEASCTSDCKLALKGQLLLRIEIVKASDSRWNNADNSYPQFRGLIGGAFRKAALAHELDHYKTYQAFFRVINALERREGTRLDGCQDRVEKINSKFKEYRRQTIEHSRSFDDIGRNTGGQYDKFPLDTKSMGWF